MISSFRSYLVEEEKVIYFSFGRMNPPTTGHGKLLDTLSSLAGKNPYRMYLSQSQDPKKNPLSYESKVKFARKMFPKHSRNILGSKELKNILNVASKLYEEGFIKIAVVVGTDRALEFETLLNKYNGKEARHGFYKFRDIKVISAGERDPDAEGIEGISASRMRDAAKNDDFVEFSQGLPKAFSSSNSKSLFNSVRSGMNLEESTDFRNHIQLDRVSTIRELYVTGNLFEVGDTVVIKATGEVAEVKTLGSNYVIIESNSVKYRKWLDAIEKIDEDNQPERGTPGATEKAKDITPGENEKPKAKKVKRLLPPRKFKAKLKHKENPYD